MGIGLKATHVAYIAHFLAFVAVILVLVWNIGFRGGLAWEAPNKALIFNLHPVFMLIGFIIIGGEAIIAYKSLPLNKPQKKLIHLILHLLALALGILGIYTAFKFHNESNIANLYSLHSWLGITVISLYAIQWIYGFSVFFFPGGTPAIRSVSLPWHVLFGIFVYILALGTASLGFLEKLTFLESSGLAKYGSEAILVNCTAIIAILFGSFVILTTLSHGPQDEDISGYTPI